jgi:protein-tyrosine-phosphatase
MNLVSYHLKLLRDEALVSARRSEADRRDLYYSLNLERLGRWYQLAGAALHPGLSARPDDFDAARIPPQRVLFICTANSARSQMAEALARALSGGRLIVSSAGSHPGTLHPDAVATMAEWGIDIRGQHSRGLDTVAGRRFDYVITVCDRAREVCPDFGAGSARLHWSLPNPAVIDDAAARAAAFRATAAALHQRLRYFLATLDDAKA